MNRACLGQVGRRDWTADTALRSSSSTLIRQIMPKAPEWDSGKRPIIAPCGSVDCLAGLAMYVINSARNVPGAYMPVQCQEMGNDLIAVKR